MEENPYDPPQEPPDPSPQVEPRFRWPVVSEWLQIAFLAIVILAILIAWLLPAVERARE